MSFLMFCESLWTKVSAKYYNHHHNQNRCFIQICLDFEPALKCTVKPLVIVDKIMVVIQWCGEHEAVLQKQVS